MTCLFLATKVEEAYTEADVLAKYANIEKEWMIRLESVVLEALKFHLRVYHPYKPLQGLLKMIKVSLGSSTD